VNTLVDEIKGNAQQMYCCKRGTTLKAICLSW